MSCSKKYLRKKQKFEFNSLNEGVIQARKLFHDGNIDIALDLFEQIADSFSENSTSILAQVFDLYQEFKGKSRYELYQRRVFDFGIKSGDKVLDIGSGHLPFPLATHLSDISLTDHKYGRAGSPFKYIEGKPYYEFNVEDIPFADKEFDFVYCSHILEHTKYPERACEELMRISQKGYIETPTKSKDLWLNSAKISNHNWFVEFIHDALIFNEYSAGEIEGLQNDILMNMHVHPQTEREKAFSALIYLKPEMVNTMLLWEGRFEYQVNRLDQHNANAISGRRGISNSIVQGKDELSQELESQHRVHEEPQSKKKLIQVHTFYPAYLESFYNRNPHLVSARYKDQLNALIRDGFSGIHMLSPYMSNEEYESELIIANNSVAQEQWMYENNYPFDEHETDINKILVKQINEIKPDILYLSDPITFDSKFIKQLDTKPKLVLGWRAADIPENTDWFEFNVMLSGLKGLRKAALGVGSKHTEYFIPGFPEWINEEIDSTKETYDIVFCGSWTMGQHTKRNVLLNMLVAHAENNNINLGLFLNGDENTMSPLVSKYNYGARFGIEMYETLKAGRIVIDARGDIRMLGDSELDLAGSETMNMRIFETTGCGAFLLAEHHDNLENLFEIGVEIETFRDESELLKKIDYYLKHDNKRNAIARRGQKRCQRDYSMTTSIEVFQSIIKKHLKIAAEENLQQSRQPEHSSVRQNANIENDAAALYKQATDLIVEKNYSKAFEILNLAKSYKSGYENIDLLRALCFIEENNFYSARQALLEELSFNPKNEHAKSLLDKLKIAKPDVIFDPEFESVYNSVESYTMLSKERLYALFRKAKEICDEDIPGNFVECGVARGGSSAILAYVIKNYSNSERHIYSFDTFEGMPEPTSEDMHEGIAANESGWGTGTCAAPMESLLKIGSDIGVSDFIIPVKGFFQDTLSDFKEIVGDLTLLHLDGDWYESTRDILNNLYDNVVFGGYLQVDDYGYWEGCRKAVHEFEFKNELKFDLNKIDETGVWFTKPYTEVRLKEFIQTDKKLLNLGCGNRFHDDWLNVDVQPAAEGIITHDLKKELPFENETFKVVYHSHLLEHLPKSYAPKLLSECNRVLKPGGIIRVVVPDLEQISRQYIDLLENSLNGDIEAQAKYQWIMLEMYDQTVRNYSGGEMYKYWQQENIPVEDFVIERIGSEGKNIIEMIKQNPEVRKINNNGNEPDPKSIGEFRLSGEIHQWMYDRYSLGKLLESAGFSDLNVCNAFESSIPGFNSYGLDVEANNSVRKPDSLFMEAIK